MATKSPQKNKKTAVKKTKSTAKSSALKKSAAKTVSAKSTAVAKHSVAKKTEKKATAKSAVKKAKEKEKPKKTIVKSKEKEIMKKGTEKKPETKAKTAAAPKAAAKKPALKKNEVKQTGANKVQPNIVDQGSIAHETSHGKSTTEHAHSAGTFGGNHKGAGHTEVEVTSPKKVTRKVKGYSKEDLESFKKIILDKRNEIIEQLQNLREQMMDPTTGQYVNENSPYSLHMAEQGTDAMEREKIFLWAQRENKFLGYLDDALHRIENGTYGICIECIDEPQNLCPTCPLIAKERLAAVPHSQLCLPVKQKQEKK